MSATPSASPERRSDNVPFGIALYLVNVAAGAMINAFVKWKAPEYPVAEIIFWRSIFALVPCGIALWVEGGLWLLRTARPGWHLSRSLCGVSSLYLHFLALSTIAFADATAIGFTAIIFTTALSALVLGERVGIHRWSAVLIGLVGVLIMLRPTSGILNWGALAAVSGALVFAIVPISLRRLGETEPIVTIVTYHMLCAAIATAFTIPFAWVWPSWTDLGWLALIGVAGGTTQFLLAMAYRVTPASILAPFGYGSLVFALALGYFGWGEVPDQQSLAGAALIVAAGLYILHRQVVRRRSIPPT
jgi:drug/metabolite transporter (DMT)-like permease